MSYEEFIKTKGRFLNRSKKVTKVSWKVLKTLWKLKKHPFFMNKIRLLGNVESKFINIERELTSMDISNLPKFHENCSTHFCDIAQHVDDGQPDRGTDNGIA